MLISEFLNKDPDMVPGESHLIILDRKSAFCMSKNGKFIKHIRHISRRVKFIRNCEN